MRFLIRLSVISLLLILFSFNLSAQNLVWYENLEKAYETAKKENKTVLLFFTGSDWCGWCKKLNGEVFTKNEFASYAKQNLILVRIDFPKNTQQSDEVKLYNRKLAQIFKVQGYPTVVLLNTSGQIVGYTGYQDGGASAYVKHLKSFL